MSAPPATGNASTAAASAAPGRSGSPMIEGAELGSRSAIGDLLVVTTAIKLSDAFPATAERR
jgi:hypothetical protein